MSDHKWARFKRAFGAKPSNELINGRVSKIADELGKLNLHLSQLMFAGLDGGEIQQRRQDLADRRATALKIADAAARYEALDGIKADARKLVADAPGIVKARTEELSRELDRVRKTVADPVKQAEDLTNPVIKGAIAATLKAVRDLFDDADGLPTEKARLDELETINVEPLTALLAQVKPIETQLGFSDGRLRKAKEFLGRMPAGTEKDNFEVEVRTLETQLGDLGTATGVEDLKTKSKTIYDELGKLSARIGKVVGEYEALMSARADVALIVTPAKAVRSAAAQAILDEALRKVEQAASDAEELTTSTAITAALRDKPMTKLLRALALATAEARNLDQNLPRLLSGIDAVIKKLPDGKPRVDFGNELNILSQAADELAPETDLNTAKSGYVRLRQQGEDLMDRILKNSGDEGLTEALSARYGVTVSANNNARINLKGTYEALEMVPPGHVDHEKIKQVIFTGSQEKGAAYGASKITIDDLTDKDFYTYQVGGKPLQVNGFNVCMLHEIGHAVDDKHRVMAGVMEAAGAGSWKSEKHDDVRAAIVTALLGEMKNPSQAVQDFARRMIGEAMENKETAKPKDVTIGRSEWKTLEKYATKTRSMTNAAEPWFSSDAAARAIGGRVYTQNNSSWYSYSLSERQANGVRNYQWRSPDEWFADLYGVAWLTNKPLGKGAPDGVARWLPG